MSYTKYHRGNVEAGRAILLTGNLLGISPYNPKVPHKYRLLPIMYSGTMLIWYSVQFVLGFYLFSEREISAPTIATIIQKSCECLVPILAILISFEDKGRSPRRIIDSLTYCDQCLYTIGIDIDTKRVQIIIELFFKFAFTYSITLLIVVLVSLIHLKVTSIRTILSVLVNLSHVFYSIFFTFFICLLVFTYKSRFQLLNEEVSRLIFAGRQSHVNVIKVKPHGVDRLKTIKTIKHVHAINRQTVSKSWDQFVILITLQLFQCLTMVTVTVYMLLCAVLSGQIFNRDALVSTTILVISLVHNLVIVLGSITYCLASTCKEANKMESIIHELMNETEDQELLRELENFSLELIHDRVVFTACDFFTIDYTLFTKIVGAVISNVIIFMQFGSTDYNEFFDILKNGTISS